MKKNRKREYNMSANDILGYVFTTISFLSVIYSVFDDKSNYACLIFILALLSFVFLLNFIRIKQNKTYTLQVLSRENRPLSIRLLLTYDRISHSKDEFAEKFSPSKLHILEGNYYYEILQSKSKAKDLRCEFTFKIKKIPKKQYSLDILVAQDKGRKLKTISYKLNNESDNHIVDVKPVTLEQNKTNFQGFWKASIPFDNYKNIHTMAVSFTLKEVYNTMRNEDEALLLCPFIYAKKIDKINIEVKYPDDSTCTPNTVRLKLYPYDGKKYRPRNLKDFSKCSEVSWKVSPSKCVTNAVYVIEIRNPS